MDIYETMLGIALRSGRYIDDEWFQTNPRDRYGLWPVSYTHLTLPTKA